MAVDTSKSRAISGNLYVGLLLGFALFFPTKYFSLYHAVAVIIAAVPLLLFLKVQLNTFAIVTVFGVLSIALSVLYTVFFLDLDIVRNTTEFFRFLPFLLLLLAIRHIRCNVSFLLKLMLFYTLINFVVAVMQFFDLGAVSLVGKIYSSELHANVSLSSNNRALGLSTGPGQHGAIMALLFAIFLSYFITLGRHSLLSLAGMLLSAFSVMLSQSQTSFIVVVGILFYGCMYLLLKGGRAVRGKLYFVLGASTLFMLTIVIVLYDYLKYLFTLFTLGFGRSSYQARLEKWNYIIDVIWSNPAGLLFGQGKDAFGAVSGAMDNEYLFLLGVYGIFGLTLILTLYGIVIVISWFSARCSLTPHWTALHLFVVSGIVLAWPTIFVLDPRVLIIIVVLLGLHKAEKAGHLMPFSARASAA